MDKQGALSSMRRMGVFIFYDASGILDEYVEVLLASMQFVLSKLIIVVNGNIESKGYDKLKKYSSDIFVRENLGFDAGGYKDTFTKYISKDEVKQWDEIIMFNDTFYGPLYSWEDIFKSMENEEVDFWGLSRHPGRLHGSKWMPQHIQSYFLVCRKPLISSAAWNEFWMKLIYPVSIQDAIESFEIGFTLYFTKNDFKCKAITDSEKVVYKGNPYVCYSFELLRDMKFPIIKRKAISLCSFANVSKALEYISTSTKYDVNLIYSHIRRLQKEGRYNIFEPFNLLEMEKFYYKHERIYIYGHGKCGTGVATYFEYRGWKYKAFIVTETRNDKEDQLFNEVNFLLTDGIILALGDNVFKEVYPIVKNQLSKEQVLLPKWYV